VPNWQVRRNHHLERYFEFERLLYRSPEDPVGNIFLSEDKTALTIKGQILCRITRVDRPADILQDYEEALVQAHIEAKSLFESWEHEILMPLEECFSRAYYLAFCGPGRFEANPSLLDSVSNE
jgi:hypothetical protein